MQSLAVTDGTEYVTFTIAATSWVLEQEYVPKPPEPGAKSIVESAKVLYYHATTGVADAITAAQALTRLFEQAKRWQEDRLGKRIYVEFQARAAEDTYRSEILQGRVVWDQKLWRQMAGRHLEALVIWERAPYWEGAEYSIPLTNAHGTDVTTGLTIYNHNDDGNLAAHDNFAAIDGTDIAGDLPAPARLEIKNTTADATLTQIVRVGHHIYSPTPHLSHVFEGEAATAGATATLTSTAEGATPCSDELYGLISLAGTSEARACYWTLSASDQTSFAGGLYRIFAKFRSFPAANCYARIKIERTNDAVIWSCPKVALAADEALQELGTLRLPPDIIPAGVSASQARLSLYLTLPAATSVELDYIVIMPLDGWRQFDASGLTLAQDDTLIDDGILSETYINYASSAGARGYGSGVGGEPIMIWPKRDQQIYVLCSEDDGKAGTDRTHTLKIVIRPRRATL